MKMAQFARFANNATNQVLGVTGLQLENLQSMFSYPDAINVTDPKLVSGKVIYIEDGAPLYAKRASIFIEPFQAGSGDPSPSNVRAISGWDDANIKICGNNIFNPNEIPDNALQTCTVNGNKFILTVLSNGNYKSSTFEIEGNFEGSTLHLSGAVQNSGNNDGRISVRFLHGDTEINVSNRLEISAQTGFSVKQAPQGTTKLLVVCYSTFLNNASTGDKSTFTDVVLSMQNELYTPFVSHDYNITFPDEAGTVYGGDFIINDGLLKENYVLISIDKDTNIRVLSEGYIGNKCTNFMYFLPDVVKSMQSYQAFGLCNMLKMSRNTIWLDPDNYEGCWTTNFLQVHMNLPNTLTGIIKGTDTTSTAVQKIKNYLQNKSIDFLFPRNVSKIYEITSSDILLLNGINTIFTNCGSMELEYYKRESGDNPYV